jgi:hypothetical protein
VESDKRQPLGGHDLAVFGALGCGDFRGVSASVKGAISMPV